MTEEQRIRRNFFRVLIAVMLVFALITLACIGGGGGGGGGGLLTEIVETNAAGTMQSAISEHETAIGTFPVGQTNALTATAQAEQ